MCRVIIILLLIGGSDRVGKFSGSGWVIENVPVDNLSGGSSFVSCLGKPVKAASNIATMGANHHSLTKRSTFEQICRRNS